MQVHVSCLLKFRVCMLLKSVVTNELLTPSLLCQDALMAKISMLVFIVLSIKEQLKS